MQQLCEHHYELIGSDSQEEVYECRYCGDRVVEQRYDEEKNVNLWQVGLG